MSTLRPELTGNARGVPCPDDFDALFMIRDSVERHKEGLLWGKLDDATDGSHCAIGCYFADNPRTALNTPLIDAVARYNDSIPPGAGKKVRRAKVLAWLNARIAYLTAKRKTAPAPVYKPPRLEVLHGGKQAS